MSLAGLALRNALRNRRRALLTALGVAVAILAFVLLRTTLDAWSSAAQHGADDRLATVNKVGFIMPLPLRYAEDIRSVPGVKRASYMTWFGAKHPTRENEFFFNLAVDSDTYFDVYHDMAVPPEQLQAWKEDRQGAIIGEVLAKQFGWKIGDEVTLIGSIYPGEWKFRIHGVYKATRRAVDRSQFIFHWAYKNESMPADRKDQVDWIATSIDPASVSQVAAAIDSKFDARDIQTQTMSERGLSEQFLAAATTVLTAMNVVSLVILVIMTLVLGNTIAMGVRERTREYGVMLAVGFRPKHVVSCVLAESVSVGLFGAALGLGLAYPIVERWLGRFLEENMGQIFPYFRIQPTVAILALGFGVLLAATAAGIPAYRAAKLNVVDALRRVG